MFNYAMWKNKKIQRNCTITYAVHSIQTDYLLLCFALETISIRYNRVMSNAKWQRVKRKKNDVYYIWLPVYDFKQLSNRCKCVLIPLYCSNHVTGNMLTKSIKWFAIPDIAYHILSNWLMTTDSIATFGCRHMIPNGRWPVEHAMFFTTQLH